MFNWAVVTTAHKKNCKEGYILNAEGMMLMIIQFSVTQRKMVVDLRYNLQQF